MSEPSSVPSRPTGSTRAVGVHDERQRVPAAGELEPHVRRGRPAGGRRRRCRSGRRRAARAARGAAASSTPLGRVLVGGGGAQRVAGERGHGGGLGALALDVADQRRPAAVAGAGRGRRSRRRARCPRRRRGSARRRPGPGTAGSAPGRSERCSVRAIVRSRVVEPRVGDRDRGELAELGRGSPRRARVNSRSARSTTSSTPSSLAAAASARADSRDGLGVAAAESRRRGGA